MQIKEIKVTRQLTVDIPDEQHARLKSLCVHRRITLRILMNSMIDEYLTKNKSKRA